MNGSGGCTRLRAIRLKHGISLAELAKAAGVSNQYMSQVELGRAAPTSSLEKKCEQALERIVLQRYQGALALEYACRVEKGRLLKEAEEGCHEC